METKIRLLFKCKVTLATARRRAYGVPCGCVTLAREHTRQADHLNKSGFCLKWHSFIRDVAPQ
jgi:hypothetical protein